MLEQTGSPCRESVVRMNFLFPRAFKPCFRIKAATFFRLTRLP
jgi:hypothetical protein